MSTATTNNAPSLSLHLPDETELEAAACSATADNAADAAEAIEADEAAAAVEEGDEDWNETGDDSGGLDEVDGYDADDATDAADDPEATLLEEPADEASEEASDSASPTEASEALDQPAESSAGPILAATPNRLTPHQPPKSAALVALEHRLAEAKDRYVGASLYRMHLEGALKTAKENEKKALEVVADIENERGLEFDGGGVEEPVREITAPASPTQDDAATNAPAPAVVEGDSESPAADENAWRRVPISELHLENIKGLGAKKIEQITDRCPTIGHLEDVRAGFDGLKALDGIGQAKADAIEDAILAWLSKNRDRAVLAAAGANAVEEVATEETAAIEPTEADEEVADDRFAETLTPDELDAQDNIDAQRHADAAEISARSQQIFFRTGDLSSVSPDDCLSQQLEDSRFWESGYEAYNAGNDLIDCPYVPGGERDDWLRGWMSAKLTNEEGWQGPGSEG